MTKRWGFSRERVRPRAPVRPRGARAIAGGRVRQRATRAGRHATTALVAAALCIAGLAAGCGSSNSQPQQTVVKNEFHNKAVFEDGIKSQFVQMVEANDATVTVHDISCIKTDPNKAQCFIDATDSVDGTQSWVIQVVCQSVDQAGGNDCQITGEAK